MREHQLNGPTVKEADIPVALLHRFIAMYIYTNKNRNEFIRHRSQNNHHFAVPSRTAGTTLVELLNLIFLPLSFRFHFLTISARPLMGVFNLPLTFYLPLFMILFCSYSYDYLSVSAANVYEMNFMIIF